MGACPISGYYCGDSSCSAAACVICPVGKYCDKIYSYPAPVGQFLSSQMKYFLHAIKSGSFVGTTGASTYTPCPAGTYTSSTGASACTLAPKGMSVHLLIYTYFHKSLADYCRCACQALMCPVLVCPTSPPVTTPKMSGPPCAQVASCVLLPCLQLLIRFFCLFFVFSIRSPYFGSDDNLCWHWQQWQRRRNWYLCILQLSGLHGILQRWKYAVCQ